MTFETQADRAFFIARFGLAPERGILLAGTGVDLSKFTPADPPASPLRVLFAGRLLHSKGVDTFLEAARLSRADGQAIEWLIAGWRGDQGSADALSEADIEDLRNSADVRFLGHVEDMPQLLAERARAGAPDPLSGGRAAHPHRGRRVRGGDRRPRLPGARRLVEPHDVSGLLMDDGAQPGAAEPGAPPAAATSLEQAAARLARDPDLRRRLADAARRRVLCDG